MRSPQELVQWLASRHGVGHSTAATAAGFSVHCIRKAIAAGEVVRVRRSWLVTPNCDERFWQAAELGGRVTCVTAASVMGLWVPEHSDTHIAVASTASRVSAEGVRLHWSPGPAPAGPGALEHILNVLLHVAQYRKVAAHSN